MIHPGLSENLNNPEGMMEMFEHQAERMKTVYTKYLSDHMKVSTILKNDLTKIFRFPILWELTLCTWRSLQSMRTLRFALKVFSTSQTCIWRATTSSLKRWSRWPTKMRCKSTGEKIFKAHAANHETINYTSVHNRIFKTGGFTLVPRRQAWRWTTGWFWARLIFFNISIIF